MPNLRGSELLIIVLLVVLLFGAKRLPDAARSVGRSLRIFKAETKGLVEGETTSADALPAQSSGGTGLPSADHRPTGASAGPAHSEPVEIARPATPSSGA